MIVIKEANGKARVSFHQMSFFYGLHKALEEVTLDIPDRMITAVIGPSGCGKSTMIKSVNRIAEVTDNVKVEGDVKLDGKSVYDPDVDVVDLRRRVGMVFQKPNPLPISIYDNVALGLRIHGIKDRTLLDQVVEVSLQRAALWNEVKDRLYDNALKLSGGQQQRLCIARTLSLDPEVILMDEPCSSLDPIGTARIEEAMVELKKEYCVVIVTHNMEQAARVSDITAFLLSGKLIEVSDTSTMFTKPAKKLTENYITGRFG